MENTEKTVEILNDLIEINNDRADGFDKASADLDDVNIDLKATFEKLSSDSRANSLELAGLVGRNGDAPDTGNTILGTLHRAWIDIKASFGGDDRHSILAECERGEDAIKKAYRDALAENELSEPLRSTLLKQQEGINAGHDLIKGLRDAHKAL
ncbi:PA2169 family four-helix-bundle protein [Pedobacter jejuensis]|uniref:PA2169 family four-helix-bundle protein n=1 Tax=Pedobacter jejuensis TaxID=1268550 RepID=A0A3N0BSR2_9SPHI|nr:PA2169 family four-helix-bundle protein [Pedobacter jejuensis]RNL52111.1 PA2169 family four-helix-bundle protein [Pedobacter jejuensis]